MPGVTENAEFSVYQTPVYKAEPVISIAPRYVLVFTKATIFLYFSSCPTMINGEQTPLYLTVDTN